MQALLILPTIKITGAGNGYILKYEKDKILTSPSKFFNTMHYTEVYESRLALMDRIGVIIKEYENDLLSEPI